MKGTNVEGTLEGGNKVSSFFLSGKLKWGAGAKFTHKK